MYNVYDIRRAPGGVLTYPAMAVANEFIQKSGFQISPLKLQKLVYYAHGWCLALTGKPLIDQDVEAWPYGPVIDSIYREFREYGSRNIDRLALDLDEPVRVPLADKNTLDLLDRIWSLYGRYSAIQLSRMTHEPGTPWSEVLKCSSGRRVPIENQLIETHFKSLMPANAR